jgi:hypothetical protein
MTAYLVISLPKTPYIVYTPYIYGSGQPYICPSCYPLHTTTQIYVHTVRLTQYMYNYCVYIHCVVHTAYVHTLHAYLLCVCPLCCPTAYVHTVCVNMEDVYIHCVFHCICPRSVCPHTTCIFTYLLCVCPLCCPTACVHTVCVNIEDVCPLCCPRSVCPHSMREHWGCVWLFACLHPYRWCAPASGLPRWFACVCSAHWRWQGWPRGRGSGAWGSCLLFVCVRVCDCVCIARHLLCVECVWMMAGAVVRGWRRWYTVCGCVCLNKGWINSLLYTYVWLFAPFALTLLRSLTIVVPSQNLWSAHSPRAVNCGEPFRAVIPKLYSYKQAPVLLMTVCFPRHLSFKISLIFACDSGTPLPRLCW